MKFPVVLILTALAGALAFDSAASAPPEESTASPEAAVKTTSEPTAFEDTTSNSAETTQRAGPSRTIFPRLNPLATLMKEKAQEVETLWKEKVEDSLNSLKAVEKKVEDHFRGLMKRKL